MFKTIMVGSSSSATNRVEIRPVGLAPEQVRQVELVSVMARFGVPGPVDDAGLDIETSGNPGAVIARLTSVDQSGDLAFDVPIKDPLAEMLRVGGSYPWRLDEGDTTVLHLKNTIDKSVDALVQVRYAGGSYNLERLPLAPYQTIAVDLRALRDGQQKDIRESVMPSDVEGGQLVWFEETIGSLIGRAEVMNPRAAVASSFSCPEPCQCSPSFSTAFLTPASSVGAVGGTAQFTANEQRQDCHGMLYGPYNRTSDSTWHSDNPSVFTVSVGAVSCLSEGSGNVTAQFSATIYTLNCFEQHPTPTSGSGVTVKTPHHLKVLSDTTTTRNCGSLRRHIQYQVVDRNGDPVGTTPTKEILTDPSTEAVLTSIFNSCQNSNFSPIACSTDTDGVFIDQLWVGCPSSGGSCGYPDVYSNWYWCPPGRPAVRLATLLYHTKHSSVLVNGFAQLPVGTEVF